MATSKTERIDREITKTREKITELQRRFRELSLQKTEAENLEIVQLVRAVRMTPQELSALLKSEPIPGIATITQEEKKEDFEDEA